MPKCPQTCTPNCDLAAYEPAILLHGSGQLLCGHTSLQLLCMNGLCFVVLASDPHRSLKHDSRL